MASSQLWNCSSCNSSYWSVFYFFPLEVFGPGYYLVWSSFMEYSFSPCNSLCTRLWGILWSLLSSTMQNLFKLSLNIGLQILTDSVTDPFLQCKLGIAVCGGLTSNKCCCVLSYYVCNKTKWLHFWHGQGWFLAKNYTSFTRESLFEKLLK